MHSRLVVSQALQVVLGPVLTHLTFERLHLTQAIEERMFLVGWSGLVEFFLPPGPFVVVCSGKQRVSSGMV